MLDWAVVAMDNKHKAGIKYSGRSLENSSGMFGQKTQNNN